MSDTEYLRTLKTEDAINLMLTNANALTYPMHGLKASAPTVLGGSQTRVTLTPRDRAASDDPYPYAGMAAVDFTFMRSDLTAVFGGELTGWRPQLPTSTQVILDELTARTGQKFELRDVVLEEIGRSNSAPYVLKAKQESLRWVGEVEFTLADIEDLATLFGEVDEIPIQAYTRAVADPQITDPYVNVTRWQFIWSQIGLYSYAQDNPNIKNLIDTVDPVMNVNWLQRETTWVLTPTPGPFNLYNAQLTSYASTDGPIRHLINPALNKKLKLELDPAYCTNLSEPVIYYWYILPEDIARVTGTRPRLIRSGVLSTSDGTAYATFLQTLVAPSTLRFAPPMLIDGQREWICDETQRTPTNLYGAVIQYNGPRRVIDNLSVDPTLTHVIILTMDEAYNTLWKGSIPFYYKIP